MHPKKVRKNNASQRQQLKNELRRELQKKQKKMTTTVSNYVFKAIEEFDYNIEYAAEALNYALAYDDINTMALTLMGRLYAERLFDDVTAIQYYKKAMAEKEAKPIQAAGTCTYIILTLSPCK